MEFFFLLCMSIVALFGISLLISTVTMGSESFVSLQVLTGSLKYSKEVNNKIDILLGKVEADLYYIKVGEHTIQFFDKSKYDSYENAVNNWRNEADIELWISNKFYSYGNIYRINGGQAPIQLRDKRPSIKLIKQILEIEKSGGVAKKPKSKDKSSKKDPVILG